MSSFNRVILVGNMTRDPELRHTPSGAAVCEIGLAVNDRVKRGDEWVDEATFVDVTLWARQAEVCCEYCQKGSSILIEGRLKLEQWEDKNDGGKRSKLKVTGERLQLLGSKQGGGRDEQPRSSGRKSSRREEPQAAPQQSEEEIPF